ncbi:hypothetical protein DESA109040_16885 [Deinococcus saxicola]
MAKLPPYMLRMTQKPATNSTRLAMLPNSGIRKYSTVPSTKKIMYVGLRPRRSLVVDQKNRPPMLKMLSRPTNPAAAAAVTPLPAPSTLSLNISWIMTLACPRTPIPAVTFRNSTANSSQNCGVRKA